MPRAFESKCMAVALATTPWIGVGMSEWGLGRSVGMGLQLSLLSCWLGIAAALASPGGRSRLRELPQGKWLLAALLWTAASSTQTWRLDQLGLAGELPWLKSLKQLGVLLVFGGCLLAPLLLRPRGAEWERLERALALGLLCASLYGLLQAVHFHLPLPGMAALDRWCSSNPSIASGSHELYLGERFVGIPRVRAGACEPLYFGSYLLAALPCVGAASLGKRGFARRWRQMTVLLAAICLVLTFSRGVYLALLAGAFCCLLQIRRTGWSWPLAARPGPVAIALGVVFAILAISALSALPPWRVPGLLVERAQQSLASHDMSNLTRLHAWQAAARAWLEQPLLGVGWGGYGFHYYRLVDAGGAAAHFGWPMANNLPLLLLAETGLIGLLLWTRALWPAWAALLRPTEPRSFLFAVLCVASLVQFLTHSQLQLPHVWLLFGFSLHAGTDRAPVV